MTPGSSAQSPLTHLEGTWVGRGEGEYPTIASFAYVERVTFTRSPKGFLVYQQFTSHPETSAPMHTEAGYVRFIEDSNTLELVVAQPTGVVEVHVASPEITDEQKVRFVFRSISVSLTPSAKEVLTVERDIEVSGNRLSYRVSMAAVGLSHQHHLSATLLRET